MKDSKYYQDLVKRKGLELIEEREKFLSIEL
jgi:hypothetical protein